MAALCQLGPDWFGILYSWADSKKKSNLMLTVLEPGSNSVPWLGNFNYLGLPKNRELGNVYSLVKIQQFLYVRLEIRK